jgi:P27 family predicted phage terminase small subunit
MPRVAIQYVWRGVSHTADEWARYLGISKVSMHNRIKRHWPSEPALVFKEADLGRYKKPAEQKKIEGTFERRDDHRTIVVNTPEGVPLPPAHLNAASKSAWAYIAGQLHEMGIMTSADGMLVEIMCITYARMIQAQETLDMRGSSTYLYMGKVLVYPEVAIVAECSKMLNQMMTKVGMSPLDRTRLTVPRRDEEEVNPFGDL